MKYRLLHAALLLALAVDARADSLWPPKASFDDGSSLSLMGAAAYDFNRVDGHGYPAGAPLQDNDDWRRSELGVRYSRPGVLDLAATYDFNSDSWLDVGARIETRAMFGRDLGRVRIGQMKTTVGLEGNTASRSIPFMEFSTVTQAFFENRRVGVDWTLERPQFLAVASYFFKSDIDADNDGDTVGARLVWTPRKQEGDVLHLGLSASRETPDSGIARWRAKPELSLTAARLVDSGVIEHVDNIQRQGMEALWQRGPLQLQGEYLRQRTRRQDGFRDYASDGWYAMGSWLLTGESRPYAGANTSNPKPVRDSGAVELLARYSDLDLDADGIAGGREKNFTVGVNWYLTAYLKFVVDYTRVDARRRGQQADPNLLQARAQLHF
ncbi:OprO/OprP family phosphate-selective porin [Pseudoxanthomonas dokdonensis]|uniref:Porin n=1 Tax=Pseudoxanthomonas dokdonensis TaxID=344882 RepID=A0A0R0CXB6_9GAMM|nr:porin [Pseudoxanthomonas dokdonensis]KRG71034.1 hypothetical protein ABB29_04220 [Pseudoxanthomonas dokdonensis]